jgi:Domain of unknown function (DUF3336)
VGVLDVVTASVVFASVVASAIRGWQERNDESVLRRRRLRLQMQAAKKYDEWALAAAELDKLEGCDLKTQTRFYDRQATQASCCRCNGRLRNFGRFGVVARQPGAATSLFGYCRTCVGVSGLLSPGPY